MKRKLDQLEEDGDPSSCSSSSSSSGCVSLRSCSSTSSISPVWDSDEEGPWVRGPQPDRDVCSPKSFTPLSILKRTPQKRTGRVAFDGVTVFYFPRCQGFTSVPSRGGCTLGMASRHHASRRFSLAEFTHEQARVRREKLRQRLREEKLEAQRQKLSAAGASSEEGSNPQPAPDAVDEAWLEEALAAAVAGGRLEEEVFLQAHPARRRRALLRAAGVRRIDREEKRELRALRRAREDCGCRCARACDPETCSCSRAGIRCQMDHTSFPCGCSKEGCANPEGRVEFNQARVQTHFVHTLARLQLERARGALGETETPDGGHPPGAEEPAALLPPFLGGSSSSNNDVGDHSCSSSDMTDSSTASSFSSSMGEPQDEHPNLSPALPASSFQPGVDPELWGEEEEEEEITHPDRLDHLSYFHLSDVFEAGSASGHWTHSYTGSNLPSGILDENANLDAASFLLHGGGGSSGLGDDPRPPGAPTPSAMDDAPQSPTAQLGCDSLGWLQTLPDYSLGPHYPSPKMPDGPECLHGAPPGCSPSGDLSHSFLESLLGFSEPATDATSPFGDSQFENGSATPSLVEPVPV
ncbi:cysteine/serine-rich nuclear protein 1 [Perognathus longimembris pacificus]|uniref:cysteine/serine-rich nuclear protein 1 n=1 Tax=Perognathus longimembris pacificus TaxID=214514 RepID=UPI002019C24F|nr:cysteine/serine-rich nuclear protein 1 [Perognathus longimembris pacificus]